MTAPERERVRSARTVTAVAVAALTGDGDDAVLAVRERLRAAGVRLPARPPHRPHVTLEAVRVTPDRLPEVVDALTAVTTRPPLPLTLAEVGRFSRTGALWLGPDDASGPALRLLHQDTVAALATVAPPAFGTSRPWTPHVTLATRLHPRESRELVETVAQGYEPVVTAVAALAVILVGGSGDEALLPLG